MHNLSDFSKLSAGHPTPGPQITWNKYRTTDYKDRLLVVNIGRRVFVNFFYAILLNTKT